MDRKTELWNKKTSRELFSRLQSIITRNLSNSKMIIPRDPKRKNGFRWTLQELFWIVKKLITTLQQRTDSTTKQSVTACANLLHINDVFIDTLVERFVFYKLIIHQIFIKPLRFLQHHAWNRLLILVHHIQVIIS